MYALYDYFFFHLMRKTSYYFNLGQIAKTLECNLCSSEMESPLHE